MEFTDSKNKLASGRYCLALIAGVVFIIAAVMGTLDNKDIVIILTVVFQSYFNKPHRPNEQAVA